MYNMSLSFQYSSDAMTITFKYNYRNEAGMTQTDAGFVP